MNALVVFSACFAAAQAGLVAPFGAYAPGFYGAYNTAPVAYKAAPALAYNTVAAAPVAYSAAPAPVAYAAAPAPVAYAAPYTYPSSQFQAQDEFGNVNYGYSNVNSAKQEVGNAYGGVTGAYSYVDANGELQRVEYIADAAGFRVKATNLPEAPVFEGKAPIFEGKAPVFDLEAPIFDGVAPEPVMDTPEVAAAKAEFQKAFDEAKARSARSADEETPADTQKLEKVELKIKPVTYAAPLAYNYGLPLGYSGLYNNGFYGYNNLAYGGLYRGAVGYNGLYGYNGWF